MSDSVIPVRPEWAERAWINAARYAEMYERSIADPEHFWGEEGERLDWIKPYKTVKNASFEGDVSIRWYEDGTLNVSANCIDRHLATRADQPAIIWEGDEPDQSKTVTYRALYENTCRMANVLKMHGVKKGDRVTSYMPMIVETA
jgi:acetyl-CoA synthetase